MRCFVAVDLDGALKPAVLEIQKRLDEIADAKLVEPENLHFTLKFLGEIDEAQATNVKNVLSGIAKDFQPLEIAVKGVGAFPSLGYIRVVWVGAPELSNLQRTVDEALSSWFKGEREITPHLTLARIRGVRGKEELVKFIREKHDAEIGPMVVDKIKLKKSTLAPRGPVYEDYSVWELKGA